MLAVSLGHRLTRLHEPCASNRTPRPDIVMQKIFPNRSIAAVCVLGITLLIAPNARAATRTKANNTDNLNLTTSWTGGVVPGSGDIALWDSTVTGGNHSYFLGADL